MKTARNDKIHEFCRLPNYRVPGVTGSWNRPLSQKQCHVAHEYGQKWKNSRVLSTPNYRVPGVTGSWNRPRSQKQDAIVPENGQKWQNSRVLSTSKLPCTGGHGQLKSSVEPKTVRYSPWKRPEMTKFTSFADFQITVYRGSRAVEIVPGTKNSAL